MDQGKEREGGGGWGLRSVSHRTFPDALPEEVIPDYPKRLRACSSLVLSAGVWNDYSEGN